MTEKPRGYGISTNGKHVYVVLTPEDGLRKLCLRLSRSGAKEFVEYLLMCHATAWDGSEEDTDKHGMGIESDRGDILITSDYHGWQSGMPPVTAYVTFTAGEGLATELQGVLT